MFFGSRISERRLVFVAAALAAATMISAKPLSAAQPSTSDTGRPSDLIYIPSCGYDEFVDEWLRCRPASLPQAGNRVPRR